MSSRVAVLDSAHAAVQASSPAADSALELGRAAVVAKADMTAEAPATEAPEVLFAAGVQAQPSA